MKRRKFIQYSALGAGSFIVNLGLYNPQPANAIFQILIPFLGRSILGFAFKSLLKGTFGFWQQRNQQWYDNRLEAMLAQSKFLSNSFTNVTAAEVESFQYSLILAAERKEQLGYNVAFAFPQIYDSQPSVANFAGPGSIGMAIAAKYLQDNQRMTPEEVQKVILPRYQDYSDFTSWSKPTSYIAYSNTASQNGVLIEYRVVKPGKGGYGTIDVTVHGNRQIIIPSIQVKYA